MVDLTGIPVPYPLAVVFICVFLDYVEAGTGWTDICASSTTYACICLIQPEICVEGFCHVIPKVCQVHLQWEAFLNPCHQVIFLLKYTFISYCEVGFCLVN